MHDTVPRYAFCVAGGLGKSTGLCSRRLARAARFEYD